MRSRIDFLSVKNFILTIIRILSFFADRFLPIGVAKTNVTGNNETVDYYKDYYSIVLWEWIERNFA